MSRLRLFYHVVWATRGREPLITPALEPHIHRHLRTVAQRHGILVHAVGGIADHVHLAITLPGTLAISLAIQRIKGGSSRAINAEFGLAFGWQTDFNADTFSERHLPQVVAYIERQHEHPATASLWPEIEP